MHAKESFPSCILLHYLREIPDFEILVNISQITVSQMSLTEMTESSQQQQHWRNTSTLSGDRSGHVEFVRHRTQSVVAISEVSEFMSLLFITLPRFRNSYSLE
jgi:hypothetical protein